MKPEFASAVASLEKGDRLGAYLALQEKLGVATRASPGKLDEYHAASSHTEPGVSEKS